MPECGQCRARQACPSVGSARQACLPECGQCRARQACLRVGSARNACMGVAV